MNKGLEIYACSGVGATDEEKKLTYYLEGTNTATNTQAQNNLLTYLNEQNTALAYLCKNDSERAKCLNMMDLYAVCFYFAGLYKNDTDKLKDVGYILSAYIDNGRFSSKSADIQEHDNLLGTIIDEIEQYNTADVMAVDTTFVRWYFDNVLALNQVGLTAEQQQAGEEVLKNAVSGTDEYGDLSQYFNKSGSYFLYLYFTDEQIKKLPRIFAIKRRKQHELYNYCLKVFTSIYGDEQAMQRIIRNGIIQDYKETPEEVVNDIYGGGIKGVGELATSIIIAIVFAVAAVLAATILGIINYAQAIQVAKYTVPEDAESGIPDSEVEDWVNKRNSQKSSSNIFLLAGLGSLAFVLLKGSKRGKKRK